ncbi:oxidoreductase [Candidatus Woesearchaeota archaeon]|nr:oxidoreductase [Candidatus Woesearchaeota archaeon]
MPEQQVKEYRLKITKIIDEAIGVKTFRFEKPKDFDFYPGQFFMLNFEENPKLKRAYSIASSPSQKHIDITVSLVGEFTTNLFKAKVNDILVFKGPYGRFYFTEGLTKDLVLISGGCGIAALMSIIRYCNEKNLKNKLSLIYSVRTPGHIAYKEELEKIKKGNSNFTYNITITRPKPEHDWCGRTGRIDEDFLKQNIKDIKGSWYYLCGPAEFVKSTIAILESLGAKKEQVKTDFWGY